MYLLFSRKKNPKFVEIITQLEKDKECHNLDLTSFLMLPVQRITRLPLLLSVESISLLGVWILTLFVLEHSGIHA